MVDFSHADIMAGRIKTVSTRSAIGSMTGSLLRDLRLDVCVTGLGIGLPGLVSQAVTGVLEPVAAPLDEVIFATQALLGVKVGEADLRVNGIRCGGAVLVQ